MRSMQDTSTQSWICGIDVAQQNQRKNAYSLLDLLQPAMYIAALQNVPSMQGSNLQGQELRKGDYTTELEALAKRPARCTNIQVSQLSL